MTFLRRRRLLLLFAAWLAAGGCAAGAAPPASSQAEPPRATAPASWVAPIWAVGDRWVYDWTSGKESGTKTVEIQGVREVGKVRYYVVRVGDVEHYYTEALHWAAAARGGKVEARMVPAQPWFQWPLVPGTRWSGQSRFEHGEGMVNHHDRFTVVGPETVEVPAGRYDTMKLTRETDQQDSDQYWYASSVRWYVRWVGRRGDAEFEERLREYQAGPR